MSIVLRKDIVSPENPGPSAECKVKVGKKIYDGIISARGESNNRLLRYLCVCVLIILNCIIW